MRTICSRLLLFFIVMSLTGCAYDTLKQTETINPADYKMSPVSWKEIKSHPELMSEIKKSRLSRMSPSETARGVYDENYGVFVDTTNIVMIQKDGKKTFTLSIVNYDENEKNVENLILNQRDDNTYTAYVAKYILNDAEWTKLSGGETLPDKKPSEIKDIATYARFTITGDGADCVSVSHYMRNVCDDANGNQMTNNGELGNGCVNNYMQLDVTLIIVDMDCLSQSGGGGEGGDSGGSGGDGGGPTGGGVGPGGGGGSVPGHHGGETGDPGTIDPRNPSQNIFDLNHPIKTQILLPNDMIIYRGLSNVQKSWWRNTQNAVAVNQLTNRFNQGEISNDYIRWAVTFFIVHPNTTWEHFANWFMGQGEGLDGEDDGDDAFWDNPNLLIQTQPLPSFDDFFVAFPSHLDPQTAHAPEVFALVGGQPNAIYLAHPESNGNTCALRVSRGLNYSGVTIPNIPGKTFKGADNKYYFLSAKNLLGWMKKTFGTPTGTNHLVESQGGVKGENFPAFLAGKKGIYILVPNDTSQNGFAASGHADLFWNDDCDGACYYGATGGVKEIFFWNLN